jgi:hypothetical protein
VFLHFGWIRRELQKCGTDHDLTANNFKVRVNKLGGGRFRVTRLT